MPTHSIVHTITFVLVSIILYQLYGQLRPETLNLDTTIPTGHDGYRRLTRHRVFYRVRETYILFQFSPSTASDQLSSVCKHFTSCVGTAAYTFLVYLHLPRFRVRLNVRHSLAEHVPGTLCLSEIRVARPQISAGTTTMDNPYMAQSVRVSIFACSGSSPET